MSKHIASTGTSRVCIDDVPPPSKTVDKYLVVGNQSIASSLGSNTFVPDASSNFEAAVSKDLECGRMEIGASEANQDKVRHRRHLW